MLLFFKSYSKKSWYYIMTTIIILFLFVFCKRAGFPFVNEYMLDTLLSLILICLILKMFPSADKKVFDEPQFRVPSINAILVPIALGVICRLIIDFLQKLPIVFGKSAISIGTTQLITDNMHPVERILSTGIIGPYFEEFLFRVIFFIAIAELFSIIDKKFNRNFEVKSMQLNSMVCWGVIIFNNILFSMIHGPSFFAFFLYFIAGLVDTVVYIKYGFYSAVISHGTFNFLRILV